LLKAKFRWDYGTLTDYGTIPELPNIFMNFNLTQQDILNLKIGDKILLNGVIFTARDRAHVFLLENNFDKIKNSIIYHCGPLVKNDKIISAGPTTSYRLNPYTPQVIEKYGIKAIIGKGGMDQSVQSALRGKAVYLSAVGGAGVLYGKRMRVRNVYKMEFGMPEAIWECEVRDFPVIVTMDAHGRSLYEEVCRKSREIFIGLVNG